MSVWLRRQAAPKTKPTPRHRTADAQRRGRLDELAEAMRQLNEELALLHQDLGMDPEPRDRRPAQDIPVQEEPREGNGERHRSHRHGGQHTTTTDAPTRVQMSMPTLMLMPRRSSSGRRRTLPR
jgi:hypothetical protein